MPGHPTRSSVSSAFKAPAVWVPPLVLMGVLVALMTLVYLGSIINPSGHLSGLPVTVVDQDRGDVGRQVTAGLTSTPAVTDRLEVTPTTLADAQHRMDEGKAYVSVVIPAGFSRALRAAAGGPSAGVPPSRATIQVLTNPRAGTVGVGLANGVLTPALNVASQRIAAQLQAAAPGGRTYAQETLLRDPVVVQQVVYRPAPPHSGLGLSAFYIAILTTFCGFLAGVIVHAALDGVLGYATTEVGPKWSQRQPIPITRWHTLLAKWAVVVPLTLVFTGLMLFVAVVVLQMDCPSFFLLWLLAWFSAAVVGIGTLALFAVLGTPGQVVALLIFVYLALASSGGTVPLEAVGGVFQFFAQFEPLRQIIAGTRSILYFDSSGPAGLTRAFVGAGIGLVLWLVVGAVATRWYDRKGLHRASPALLEYIDTAVKGYAPAGSRQED